MSQRKKPHSPPLESMRTLPAAVEAEQAVLGGLLLQPDAWDRVADQLVEADFFRHDHQLIFRAITELQSRKMPPDAVTLGEWFETQGIAQLIGGSSYILELANNTPSAANIEAYATLVRDKAILRQLIDASTESANSAWKPDGRTVQTILEEAEQRVFRIAESGTRGRKSYITTRDAAREAFGEVQYRFENKNKIFGVPSGLIDLDRLTTGFQPGDLVIIAARPSMGKTALALNIAEYCATRTKKAVAMFSLEMSASQLGMRLISSIGRVNAQHLKTGDLLDEDWPRVTSAITVMSSIDILFDDTRALSPLELRAKARRIAREFDLGLVVVDYLQLMSVPGTQENRATEISAISRSLKSLAGELKVPVVALSQLNRSLEQRTDKRPLMADLRESGAIEQDADTILFIYRDEYYNADSPDKGIAEIIVGKQRNGPTGMVKATFLPQYTRFENYGPNTSNF